MKAEQQRNEMNARIKQVFPLHLLNKLAPQQETLINNAIHRVVQREGYEAVTVDRLEGFKELVTQYLWFDALTTVSEKLQDDS